MSYRKLDAHADSTPTETGISISAERNKCLDVCLAVSLSMRFLLMTTNINIFNILQNKNWNVGVVKVVETQRGYRQ